MKMSDFIWQHQKYAGPEIYVVTYEYQEKQKEYSESKALLSTCIIAVDLVLICTK